MSDLLKNKISAYEVLPPAEVWANISAELKENQEYLPVAEKMYNYEVQPPVDSWSGISLLINQAPAAPVRRMKPLVFKLAAAAVLIGVILVGSLYFLNIQKSAQQVVTVKEPSSKPEAKEESVPPATEPTQQPTVATSLPNISYTSTQRIRSSIKEGFKRKKRMLAASRVKPGYYDLAASNNIAVHANLIRNESGDIIHAPYLITSGNNDEYISVTGPNGQQTRISAKFANVLLYLNGNENMEDEEWQRRFQEWRNKIMQTSFIPSSNNFLDILELKDFILKDNQQ